MKKFYENSKNVKFVLGNLNTDISHYFSSLNKQKEKPNNLKNKFLITKNIDNNVIKKKRNREQNLIIEEKTKKSKCSCKNSKCLKFYCECFSKGKYCFDCSCNNCQNKEENQNILLQKYNDKFNQNLKINTQINIVRKKWKCNCKNSNCNKNYCDCFHNGKHCTANCKCVNCKNRIQKKLNKTEKSKNKKKISPIKNNKDIINNYNQSTAEITEKKLENKINDLDNRNRYKNIFRKLDMDNC